MTGTALISIEYFVLAVEFVCLLFASFLKDKKAVFLLLAFIAATILIFSAK